MNRTRAFLFEDDYFDQLAIETILKTIPEIEYVGVSYLPDEALEICKRKDVQLIIVDAMIHNDKRIGPQFVRMVRDEMSGVRILGLTREKDTYELLKQAGCDFVSKKDLIESPTDARRVIRQAMSRRPIYPDMPPPVLTDRQNQVLLMICDGKTEVQIMEEMGLASRRSVRRIKDELFGIFGACNNIANLVDLAYRTGYLNPKRD